MSTSEKDKTIHKGKIKKKQSTKKTHKISTSQICTHKWRLVWELK